MGLPPYPLLQIYDSESDVRGKVDPIWVRKVFQII
jgi:hypothetical protein